MLRFSEKLRILGQVNRLRSLQKPTGIDLSSNDYLGMRDHPALRAAAIEALEGGMYLGSGGSRLLRGHTEYHEALEEYAAQFFEFERALYFPTGYQANAALFGALPARHDVIVYDELIHASAREAIQNNPALRIKVGHNDLQSYEDALKIAQQKISSEGQIWIAVEALYSMDGDFCPVVDIYNLAQKYDAVLVVDEAHATAVWGEKGRGISAGLPRENLIVMHGCGKAVGVAGGLICAPANMIDYLINTARPFIYSTAPMPLQAFLVNKSLEILAGADGEDRREKLKMLIKRVQHKFGGSSSQIQPVLLGSDDAAIFAAQKLQAAGFDVRAIRPPSVPEGTARLRVSIGSHLDEKTLDDFAAYLLPILREKEAA